MLRPILMLARAGLCMCHSIAMSGNPLSQADIDDLGMAVYCTVEICIF